MAEHGTTDGSEDKSFMDQNLREVSKREPDCRGRGAGGVRKGDVVNETYMYRMRDGAFCEYGGACTNPAIQQL